MVNKRILIVRNYLPKKFKKLQTMFDGASADYLGQILLLWDYNIPYNARVPSELGQEIPFLVSNFRGRFIDTTVTLDILKLDYHPQDMRERRLVQILSPLGFTVEFE